MTQDEIIRMAMEAGAIERYFGNQLHGIAFHKKEWLERFAALVAAHEREKLAEQKPVALEHFGIPSVNGKQTEKEPVVRNLTAAEIKDYRDKHCVSMMAAKSALINEQALKNKTIEQSPVAEVILRYHPNGFGRVEECKDIVFLADVEVGTKLFAAPVQQVDLTDDEIESIMVEQGDLRTIAFARSVIAKFKEKNRG